MHIIYFFDCPFADLVPTDNVVNGRLAGNLVSPSTRRVIKGPLPVHVYNYVYCSIHDTVYIAEGNAL